jgi:hypothetical protein
MTGTLSNYMLPIHFHKWTGVHWRFEHLIREATMGILIGSGKRSHRSGWFDQRATFKCRKSHRTAFPCFEKKQKNISVSQVCCIKSIVAVILCNEWEDCRPFAVEEDWVSESESVKKTLLLLLPMLFFVATDPPSPPGTDFEEDTPLLWS